MHELFDAAKDHNSEVLLNLNHYIDYLISSDPNSDLSYEKNLDLHLFFNLFCIDIQTMITSKNTFLNVSTQNFDLFQKKIEF